MSTDVAKKIYDLAVNDTTYSSSSSDIKDAVKERYESETDRLRKLLKEQIKAYILKAGVDTKQEYNLTSNNYPFKLTMNDVKGVKMKPLFDSRCCCRYDGPNSTNTYYYNGKRYKYLEATGNLRNFVKDVLIPLDFDWYITHQNNGNGHSQYHLIVMWNHWKNK